MVPGARGTIFDSPDTARDLDDLGGFWRARLDLQYPLFTFGALAETERAASAAVASRRERVRSRRDAGLELAATAYFNWQLARRTLSVLEDVRGNLDEHLALLLREREAHERLVLRERDVDDLAYAELPAAAHEHLVAARETF